MLFTRGCRNLFSVINKVRFREKIKQPPVERVVTKPHQIGDVIGTANY